MNHVQLVNFLRIFTFSSDEGIWTEKFMEDHGLSFYGMFLIVYVTQTCKNISRHKYYSECVCVQKYAFQMEEI